MAILYSDQYQRALVDKRMAKSNEWGGRGRFAFWSMPIPDLNGFRDVIYLARLPVGARILKGMEAHTGLSDGGGNPTISIGTPADLSKYLGETSVGEAGFTFFANTIALGMGTEITTGNTEVVAEIPGDNLRPGEFFRGWIKYMLD